MPIGAIGMAIISGVISAITANEAQKKESKRNLAAQKELMEHGQKMGLETWEKTGAQAQREQLKKAGLNPGLMYSGTGGGGQTTSTPTGTVGRGNPMGIDLSRTVEAARQKAEIENIQADTKKKEVETENLGGVEREAKTMGIEKLKAEIANLSLDGEYKVFENEIAAINRNVAKETESDAVYSIKAASTKLMQETRQAMVKTNVDEATQESMIKQINTQAVEQALRIVIAKQTGANLKMQHEEISAKINELASRAVKIEWDMEYGDREQALKERETLVKEIGAEFMYGDEAKAIRAFGATREVMNFMGGYKIEGYNPDKGKVNSKSLGQPDRHKKPSGDYSRTMRKMGRK